MKNAILECVDPDKAVKLVTRKIDDADMDAVHGPRVYVVGDAPAKKIRRQLSELIDRQPKNSSTQPSRVFGYLKPGESGIFRREYKSCGQLLHGVRTVLRNLRERQLDVACFMQIPDALFTALLDLADPYQPDPKPMVQQDHANRMIALADDILRDEPIPDFLRSEYIGNAVSVERVRQMIWKVSKFPAPVIITGESGTGKEIIARCIHQCSKERGRGPTFNPINCGAVQAQLFESELFGHAKHSFTDARYDRVGLWESAGNGTLFLDEVADLEPSNQVKMLRALETNTVRPVGSNREVDVSARIVSATNRDLHSMTRYGTFRSDLYYRLNTFRIVAPPLREHLDDMGVIAQFLWEKVTNSTAYPLPDEVIDALANYNWPGNVRELHSVITVMHTWHGHQIDSREQAEMAMFVQANPAALFASSGTEAVPTPARLAATMRHLTNAEQALDDARNFFRSRSDASNDDRDEDGVFLSALDDRCRELTALTSSPLLFGAPECFNAVQEATGKLAFTLDSLHADIEAFSTRDQRDIQKSISNAREQVAEQIEKTRAQVRS